MHYCTLQTLPIVIKSVVDNNFVKSLAELMFNIIYTHCLGTRLISLMKTMITNLIFNIIIKYLYWKPWNILNRSRMELGTGKQWTQNLR